MSAANSPTQASSPRPQACLRLDPGAGRYYGVVGHKYRVLVGGEHTDGLYGAIEGLIPPGDGPPPHHHENEDEAFYVVEGRIAMMIDGSGSMAPAGSFVLIPKGTVHTFTNPGPGPARILMTVSPAGFEKMFAAVGIPINDPEGDPPPATVEHIKNVVDSARKFGCVFHLKA